MDKCCSDNNIDLELVPHYVYSYYMIKNTEKLAIIFYLIIDLNKFSTNKRNNTF